MSRYVYLVRHGEQQDAEHGLPDGPLSGRGQRQATAIAERLSGVPFASVHTSPLQRAVETARTMTARMPSIEPVPTALLMDCIPSGPSPDMPHAFESFFGGVTEAEIAAGEAQMADATAEWLSPSRDDRHDLLITHNFVIAWFVREVFDAPAWRWMGVNQANCGLTIIRVRSAKPPVLVAHNDLGHLPVELRTGLPVDQPF
ncbi:MULTISPECIES: histidine phosphatase family protein [unclassified Microcella]|uniref:histidine phosphatase family protein n=1 Tax=unclassified Microcella TaxID=2630066 RepID=UPI000700E238|nr:MULTISPECIES: histidine phosphatase family protein [unclassified Microcella]KQV26679.1 histidine phosphatase [Yonghaparkia sp. Root332]KRF32548.1 histidine phosphatase [Yonghaparkia sp. Soil809]